MRFDMNKTGIGTDKRDAWIQTASGHRFHPFAPNTTFIHMKDIACGLSKAARFAGQTDVDLPDLAYSVAQHSVYVSKLVSPRAKMWGLMHDAPEAFIVDLATPIKFWLPEYKEMEDGIHAAIILQHDIEIDDEIHAEVKAADNWMLHQEGAQLMHDPLTTDFYPPTTREFKPVSISVWPTQVARQIWTETYYDLVNRSDYADTPEFAIPGN